VGYQAPQRAGRGREGMTAGSQAGVPAVTEQKTTIRWGKGKT
jgi:hypothetical protein